MKRFILTIVCLLAIVGFTSQVYAETLTFEWTQSDTTNLKEWKLFWGDASGGPYTEAAVIPYDPHVAGPIYSSPATLSVTGEQGTNVTKYFVLVACGDIPQADGSTEYLCSKDSNEVSNKFWIPAGVFSVPVNFQIKAE
jgi:hypothetical protein